MDYTPATLAGAGLEQVNHVKLHAGQVGLVAEYEDKFGAYSEKNQSRLGHLVLWLKLRIVRSTWLVMVRCSNTMSE